MNAGTNRREITAEIVTSAAKTTIPANATTNQNPGEVREISYWDDGC